MWGYQKYKFQLYRIKTRIFIIICVKHIEVRSPVFTMLLGGYILCVMCDLYACFICVTRDLYAWCVRFANNRVQMRTISKLEYVHNSQFVLFQSTNLACISKKVRMRIFPSAMREVTASRRDCAHKSESTSIHYAQFTNFWHFHA